MADKDFKVKQGLDLGIPLSISEGGTGQTSSTNAINALLPVQTGENGKFLTTDGTNTYWAIDNSGVSLNGGSTIISSTTSTKGLIVKAINSQTANIFEIQNPTGGIIFAVSPVAEVISYRRFNVLIPGASTIGSIIKGAPSQTADLQQWQDSTGAILASVSPVGTIRSSIFASTTTSLTYIATNFDTSGIGIVVSSAAQKGLIVRGAASQTANLQEWQDSTGAVLSTVGPLGAININTSNSNALGSAGLGALEVKRTAFFDSGTAATVAIIVRGRSSQTANLQEWQNSAGTVLTSISSGGNIVVGNTGTLISYASGRGIFALGDPASVGLTVKGAASQTANLQEWQNSAGSIRLAVSSYGTLNSYTEAIFNNTLNGTGTALLVKTNNAGGKPLVVQGAASQTANLQEWQNSNGGVDTAVTSTGRLSVRTTLADAGLNVGAPSAATVNLIVRGAASQTADLQQWQDSAGTIKAFVGSGGNAVFNGIRSGSGSTTGAINAYTTAAQIGILVRGAASQTADLQQWQNSAGTVLAEITANGGLELNGKDIELITIAGAL